MVFVFVALVLFVEFVDMERTFPAAVSLEGVSRSLREEAWQARRATVTRMLFIYDNIIH
jgi:hypothetical protein